MKERHITNKIWIYITLVLLVMGLIFFFSSQPGEESSKLSGFFTEKVLVLFEKSFGQTLTTGWEPAFKVMDHIVRKFGHFFEYFVLGLLSANLFFNLFHKKKKVFCFAVAFALCAVYAISDEFHQIFVPGRTAHVTDVLLDSTASAIAITIVFLFFRFGGKKEKRMW